MTAEQIRASFKCIQAVDLESEMLVQGVLFLQEIAAQLAEHNAFSERIASALEGLERR